MSDDIEKEERRSLVLNTVTTTSNQENGLMSLSLYHYVILSSLFFVLLLALFNVPIFQRESLKMKPTVKYFSLGNEIWQTMKPQNYTSSPLRKIGANCYKSVTGSFKQRGRGCCDEIEARYVNVSHSIFLDLIHAWTNMIVVFTGDSLTRQTVDSLSIYLKAFNISHSYERLSTVTHRLILPHYNITIFYLWFFGIDTSPLNFTLKEKRLLVSIKEFEKYLKNCDVSYVNFGLHHSGKYLDSEDNFYLLLGYVLSVIKKNPKTNAQNFYRLTYPQHYASKDGNGGISYDTKTQKRLCITKPNISTVEHPTSFLARKYFLENENNTFVILDYNPFLNYTGDLHALTDKHDCSHWCWNSQMWNGIWYLMVKALSKK